MTAGGALGVIAICMLLLGLTLHSNLRQHAIDLYTATVTHYAQTVLEDMLNNFDLPLETDDLQAISRMLVQIPVNRDVTAVKIWQSDGTVIYSTNPSQVGTVLLTPAIERAMLGHSTTQFDEVSDDDGAMQASIPFPLIEIYVPILDSDGNVSFIAEFYHDARGMLTRLEEETLSIWLSIAAATVGMFILIISISVAGGRIIKQQQAQLRRRFAMVQRLASRNRRLKLEAEAARSFSITSGHEFLSMLGAHLHDGPVQMLSLLVLQLSQSKKNDDPSQAPEDKAVGLAQAVLTELRSVAEGLVLPELDGLSGAAAVEHAVDRHRSLTGTKVKLSMKGSIPDGLDSAIKICVYRVICEGLHNSYKHAGGNGQEVNVVVLEDDIQISIKDAGGGGSQSGGGTQVGGLGLIALRRHVSNISGSISVNIESQGTLMKVNLPLRLTKI